MHHLLHVFPTFVPAGPQVRTVKLLSAFGDEFLHTIIAMDGRTLASELIPENVAYTLREPPPKAGTPRTASRMRAILKDVSPDLCLTYNFGAIDTLLAAGSLGMRRVVHHEDGFLPDEAHGFKRRRIWARRAAFACAARVVVISKNLESIARELWRVPPKKLVYIANGIDVATFESADRNPPLRRELGLPRDAVVIGSVGHLRPEKNFARLLRAVAAASQEHPRLYVLLLGNGPELEALTALAGELGLTDRVHFAGYQADPRPWYRAMDVFALTSDTEQAPIALIEAMATGLPVVATAVGDVRAMVAAETTGRVVPLLRTASSSRPTASGEGALIARLATQLSELAAEPELRIDEGALQRARARDTFAADDMVAHYREVYRDVLAR